MTLVLLLFFPRVTLLLLTLDAGMSPLALTANMTEFAGISVSTVPIILIVFEADGAYFGDGSRTHSSCFVRYGPASPVVDA